MAITLGDGGGVIERFYNLVRFGLGGKMGSGKQMMSWVHITDICRAIEFLYAHKELDGVFNISSPSPLSNKEFMRLLRKSKHMPLGIPTPKWILSLGAFFIGTETELILKSRWVLPKRITDAGFRFEIATPAELIKSFSKQ